MQTKISAEQFYDQLASNYDAIHKDPKKANAQHVTEAAKIFQKYNSSPRGSVLDLGCGTGLISELLQGELEYTGIDVSQKMLDIAAQRGYKTIYKSIEDALPEIPDNSHDFVFALSCLCFVSDMNSVLMHLNRIARQTILLSLDDVTQEFIRKAPTKFHYNHSQVDIPNTKEDYFIKGWTSPTTGITIQTRMIYIEKAAR
ncbi:class I SAM-dependent methyltransferase [Myxosarcina sp. GI1]|uniref:class I SAM-dependent DNA methyltransferase n=1 Tax=Myxosarcina sp. GI1 TaxID=1541065 RepID=UPI000565DE0C|nr:class I SAM-dependent methyltransferase [Myxosarcina sp. GI1]